MQCGGYGVPTRKVQCRCYVWLELQRTTGIYKACNGAEGVGFKCTLERPKKVRTTSDALSICGQGIGWSVDIDVAASPALIRDCMAGSTTWRLRDDETASHNASVKVPMAAGHRTANTAFSKFDLCLDEGRLKMIEAK